MHCKLAAAFRKQVCDTIRVRSQQAAENCVATLVHAAEVKFGNLVTNDGLRMFVAEDVIEDKKHDGVVFFLHHSWHTNDRTRT